MTYLRPSPRATAGWRFGSDRHLNDGSQGRARLLLVLALLNQETETPRADPQPGDGATAEWINTSRRPR